MNLVIDIGNSFVKAAVFDGETECMMVKRYSNFSIKEVKEWFNWYSDITHSILSTVGKNYNDVENYLSERTKFIKLSNKTKIPIKNNYYSTSTLGKDRIAAVVGANFLYPNKNLLVIDTGSAITFDVVVDDVFIGGNISLGMEMRYKALNSFTENLPLLKYNDNFELIGKNTNEAIVSGVQNGILAEVENYINVLKKKYSNLNVILTGGDILFFEKRIKSRIFAEPILVLIGLNRISYYNNAL